MLFKLQISYFFHFSLILEKLVFQNLFPDFFQYFSLLEVLSFVLFQICLIHFDSILAFSHISNLSLLSLNILNILIIWSVSDITSISILSHFDAVIFVFVFAVTYFLLCLEIFYCELFEDVCGFMWGLRLKWIPRDNFSLLLLTIQGGHYQLGNL